MGYYEALARKTQKTESEELSKRASKKSLWGSIGRTVGGLGAMALTGGAVNPLTLGLITGGATFLGGAVGAGAAGGKLGKEGGWFEKEGQALQREFGAFGTKNITESLKSGITAGIGQKLKLMKSKTEAAKLSEGFGLDFEGSMVGKGIAKRTAAKELSTMRGWQGQYESLEKEKLLSSRPTKPSVPHDLEGSYNMPWEQGKDIEQFSEFGKYGAMEESLQGDKMLSNWKSPPKMKYGSGTDYTSTGDFRTPIGDTFTIEGSTGSWNRGGLSSEPTEMIEGEWVNDLYKNKWGR